MAARRGGKEIDPSRLAAIEKGDLARSVVATGKVQPLTKVEIKSKASGLVKRLFVDYGDTVKEGQVLAELDREQLEAAVREARANLLAAEASWQRNKIEAEGPDLPFLKSGPRAGPEALRRRPDRALPARGRGQGLPDGAQQADGGEEPGRGQQGRGGEGARGPRALPDRPAVRDDHEPDGRPRPLPRRRGGGRGELDPRPRLPGDPGDDPGRRERGLRARQGGRGGHRPRLHGPAGAHRGRVLQGQVVRGQGHEDLAARARRRTTSPPSRCASPSRTPAES